MRRKQGFQQGKGAFISYYVYCCWSWWPENSEKQFHLPKCYGFMILGWPSIMRGLWTLLKKGLGRPSVECWWCTLIYAAPCRLSVWLFQTIMLCLQPSHRNCLRVKLERVPGVSLPLGMLPKSPVKALLLVDQNTCIIAPGMWTCSQRIQMAPNWNQFREGLIIFQWCENVVPKNIESSVGVLGK